MIQPTHMTPSPVAYAPQHNPFAQAQVAPALHVAFPVARPYQRQSRAGMPLRIMLGLLLCCMTLLLCLNQTPIGQKSIASLHLRETVQRHTPAPILASIQSLRRRWPLGNSNTDTANSAAPAIIRQRPVQYTHISSRFGLRNGRPHQGVDFAAPHGNSIWAMSPGRVIVSGWQPGYGRTVILDHGNGLKTRYAHCASLLVQPGQYVSGGALIAKVGSTGHSTGPHLHFEVIQHGTHRNPANYLSLQ